MGRMGQGSTPSHCKPNSGDYTPDPSRLGVFVPPVCVTPVQCKCVRASAGWAGARRAMIVLLGWRACELIAIGAREGCPAAWWRQAASDDRCDAGRLAGRRRWRPGNFLVVEARAVGDVRAARRGRRRGRGRGGLVGSVGWRCSTPAGSGVAVDAAARRWRTLAGRSGRGARGAGRWLGRLTRRRLPPSEGVGPGRRQSPAAARARRAVHVVAGGEGSGGLAVHCGSRSAFGVGRHRRAARLEGCGACRSWPAGRGAPAGDAGRTAARGGGRLLALMRCG